MASFSSEKSVRKTESELLSFFSDFNNWAELIPGYLNHGIEDGKNIWVFHGDFGIIKKAVKVSLDFRDSTNSNTIEFNIIGLSDSIEGHGSFFFQHFPPNECQVITTLNLKATGFLSGMMNPILDDFVPQLTEQFSENILSHFIKNNLS